RPSQHPRICSANPPKAARRWSNSSHNHRIIKATDMANVWQQPLPKIYQQLSDAELRVRIQIAKETLGKRLVILGHHYQQDEVVEFADFTGDSFELSRKAADQKDAEFVIFCGVHFMA